MAVSAQPCDGSVLKNGAAASEPDSLHLRSGVMNLLVAAYPQRMVSRPGLRYSHDLQTLRDSRRLKTDERQSEPKRTPSAMTEERLWQPSCVRSNGNRFSV